MIKVYCDYHTPTIRYAKQEGEWFIVPAVQDGWQRRRSWEPSKFMVNKISQPGQPL